jgi:hypothetical protein
MTRPTSIILSLLFALFVVNPLYSYDPIFYCGPIINYRTIHYIFNNESSSQFNGIFINAGIGADSNKWSQRQLHVAVSPPNAFISRTGFGGGYEASFEVGIGKCLCRYAYLGGRVGYHLFGAEHKQFLTASAESIRISKNQGGIVDLMPGLPFCGNWLLNLIIGCEYDQYGMLGYNSSEIFRLQTRWGWALRLGAGLHRMLRPHLALGLEYVHAFPGNVTWPGPITR